MPTIEDVERAIAGRKLERRTQEALRTLVRCPSLSYRQAAKAHDVDPGRLHRVARLVPGLVEMRSDRRCSPRMAA